MEKGEPLAEIHTNQESSLEEAEAKLRAAITIGQAPSQLPALILKRMAK